MEIEYSYEVLEVFREEGHRGAQVLYTPDDETLTPMELFVPVPFHKAVTVEAAREVMQKKIAQRAPLTRWLREKTPPPVDNSEEIVNELGRTKETGRGKAGEPDTPRRPGTNPVPRPRQPAG